MSGQTKTAGRRTSLLTMALLAAWGPAIARADSPPGAIAPVELPPLSDVDEVAATKSEPVDLAARVDALEKQLHDMEAAKAKPAADKKADKDKGDKDKETPGGCKPIEVIAKPTFNLTGRIVLDGVSYDDDSAAKSFFHTDRDNEFGFRTFRIGAKGNIWENLTYTSEFEVRGTTSAITYKDIYMEQQAIPGIGHLRAGHFKEPIGLEEEESDLFLTFMERSPADQAFAPARNFGVMAWDTLDSSEEFTWLTGIFRADSPDSPTSTGLWRSDENDWSYDLRLAWLPYYDEPSNGRYLVHVGTSYSFRHIGGTTPGATYNQNIAYNTLNGLAEFSNRSWIGTQGPIGLGAEANSDQWNQLDGELLVIWGAISLQSEYFQVLMNSGEQFNGGYASLSYFLTGESLAYRKDLKLPDRSKPYEPFFAVDTARGASFGSGAWEISGGFSWVDLQEGHDIVATTPATAANRRRGFYDAAIIGLTWYQNPWSRMYFDVEHEFVDFVTAGTPSADSNLFGVRWQVDW